jgi:hypothetical protein
MRLRALIAIGLTISLLGCGSTQISPPPTAPAFANVSGNWEFQIHSTAAVPGGSPATLSINLGGGLISAAGSVTGMLRSDLPLFGPACYGITPDVPVSGSVDTAGNLTLNFPLGGGTATIALNVNQLSQFTATATYQVAGGTCAQASTPVTAFEVANFSGTYTGTATQLVPTPTGTAPTANVTLVVTQSNTPNSDSEFPLTGTLTSIGACNSTLTFTQGVVYGDQIHSYQPTPSANSFIGIAETSNQQILVGNLEQLTGCGATVFVGTLTRQ